MRFITTAEILALHTLIIETTGGEPGLLDRGKIEFTMKLVRGLVLRNRDFTIIDVASLILRDIICGHPFIDGNKRAGFEAADLFLQKNGYFISIDVEEGLQVTLSIARGEMSMDSIRDWLTSTTKEMK